MSNKYFKYKRLVAADQHKDLFKRTAVEVLYDKMIFYDQRARILYAEIIKVLKKDKDTLRGDLIAQMIKHMQRANDIAIDCAAKLAPYQTARLQSVEIDKKITHRFVIQAPQQSNNTQAWLDAANKQLSNGKLIEHQEVP